MAENDENAPKKEALRAAKKYLKENDPRQRQVRRTVVIIFAVLFAFMVLSLFFGGASTAEEQTVHWTRRVFDTFSGFITTAATSMMCFQIFYMAEQERMDVSNSIYQNDREVRNLRKDAEIQLEKFKAAIDRLPKSENAHGEKQRPSYELLTGDYPALRDYSYHYEYLGYLVLRGKIHFGLIFDTISFPDFLAEWLTLEKDQKPVEFERREKCRADKADFWNGCEFLYLTYQMKRLQNKLDGLQKEYEKQLNYPILNGRSLSDIQKDINDTEPKYNRSVRIWYKFYKSIPK